MFIKINKIFQLCFFLHIDGSANCSVSLSDLRHKVMTLLDQKYSTYHQVLYIDTIRPRDVASVF